MNDRSIILDHDSIGARAKRITNTESRRCKLHEGESSAGCWCIRANEDGSNASCPPLVESLVAPDVELAPFRLPDMTVPWNGKRR